MPEFRSSSGCPTSADLTTYSRGLLPPAEAEQVTLHVAECARCEETVVALGAASALKLVGPLQVGELPGDAIKQPFVDETECVEVVARLRRQGPFADDTPSIYGAGSPTLLNLPTTTRRELSELVTTLGLATADELATEVATLSETEQASDGALGARALAMRLVQAGKLTEFQAHMLLTGRGKSLAFGEYLLVDRCGAGGMGQVFRARHRRMDRVVALKVMSSAALANADALKRFEREARAAAKLIHPHIVHAYDAGSQDGVPYLVMEYVAGCDLATLVKRDGKLEVKRACDYLAQAARGLVFAHEQGIVHRDIKPGNLLVSEAGNVVKVLDLGLARFHEPSVGRPLPAGELTNSGALMGTVDYMAPEQALNTSRADAKADVYSLGCTLFRVLTGENVFAGDTMMEKLVAHREQQPRRLRTLRPDAPEELDELIAAMLAKQPSARPMMADAATRLSAIARPSNDCAAAQRMKASRRKRMVVGAVVSLTAVVALVIALRRWPTPQDANLIADGDNVGVSKPELGGAKLAANSIGPPAAVPKPNLYIYPEPYVPGRKTIVVDSVRFEEEGPMTIEAWVVAEPNASMKAFFDAGRRTPINSSDLPAFFEFGGGAMIANARAAWEIHPDMPDVRQVGFGFRTLAPRDLVHFSGQLIGSETGNTTEWHHVAVSISALSSGMRIIRRWWDGVAVAPPVFSMAILEDPAEYLRSSGFIDELRVSRSERYITEFKPERRLTADADTIALYHCDEGEGDVLVDASVHGNHGKLVGARWASVDRFRTAAPRSAPVIPWTKPPRSSVVTMPALPAPKPAPKSSTPGAAAAKTNADGTPRDNLFVYPDKFDINEPIITVDAIHDDFPDGYTIEAWTVADETLSVSLREHFNRTARSAAQPAFFEFNHSPGIQATARATWKVLGQGFNAERRYYLSNRLKAPPPQQTLGRGVTFNNFQLMNDWQTQPELNHIAISFGPAVDGKQTSTYWWNGAGTPSTFAIPFIHDPLDVLRSHGYIDELRVSKGERYKKEFVPRRRFEPDADTIALYHCDEGGGDVLLDSSGHERHGKLKNAKWASTSPYATAMPRFLGQTAKQMIERTAPDNFYVYGGEPFDSQQPTIEVPSLKFDPSGPMTIEAWVVPEPTPSLVEFFKRRETAPTEAPAFFEFAGSGVPQARASWTLATSHVVGRRLLLGQKAIVKGATPAGDQPVFADAPLMQTSNSDLHHIAICFGAETDRTRMVRHWINGLEASFPPTLMPIAADPRDVFRSFGYIDELRISKTVRYDKQFDPHRRFEPDADTIALYHCDEGSGEVLYDSSGNHHHGRLTNAKWASTAKHKVFDWRPDLKKSIAPPKTSQTGDHEKSPEGQASSAAPAGPDLYIYGEPFDPNVPTIEVDTLRYDGSTPLTIEAWIVPVHTAEMLPLSFTDTKAVTAFDFGGGEKPLISVTWPAASSKAYDIVYSVTQRFGPHKGSLDIRPTSHMSQFGRAKHRELQHVAVTFGRVENGKQYVARWFNGERPIASRGYIKPTFDVRDHLRSSGFIDELRISKVERYTDKFKPERRFEPDADTLALYHCDEGSGDVLIDAGGLNNHGRLKNAKWAPVASLPFAPPGISERDRYHLNRRWVGGSSPKAPAVLEVEPLPPEVPMKTPLVFRVRIRNASDKPLPLLSYDFTPLTRHVLLFNCAVEALDPLPDGLPGLSLTPTERPNTFRFRDNWALPSERFELAPGEWEAIGIDMPNTVLPPGRYRIRCRILPQGNLGQEQEAAFEFRIVDKPADQLDKTPGTEVVWTYEGLKPLPAPVRGRIPTAIPAATPKSPPSPTAERS